jgi:hypothetical protein
MPGRITLRLSDEARRGWDRTVIRHGVTLTAFAEALGLALLANPDRPPIDILEHARQIDFERRNRSPS